MNIAGIVAEYNPFHSGHLYHINKTRELLGEDCAIVCVMSGNFVQRGEPAMFSKHVRAKSALLSGADLILELPVTFALSSAENFAFGAVSLLDSLSCVGYLSFGSESGKAGELDEVARLLLTPEMDNLIVSGLKTGMSYPAARQKAAETLYRKNLGLMREPNNILGIEYLKALIKLDSDIRPLTFKRRATKHDSKVTDGNFASAAMLRTMITSGQDMSDFIPQRALEIFKSELDSGHAPITLTSLEPAIMARLRMMDEEYYDALPDASEGLGLRLMKYAKREYCLEHIIAGTKTKRYATTRIKRMIIRAALGISAYEGPLTPPYARVLAFNERGRAVLRAINPEFPVITKPSKAPALGGDIAELMELEARVTDFYVLGYPNPKNREGGSEWKKSPFRAF